MSSWEIKGCHRGSRGSGAGKGSTHVHDEERERDRGRRTSRCEVVRRECQRDVKRKGEMEREGERGRERERDAQRDRGRVRCMKVFLTWVSVVSDPTLSAFSIRFCRTTNLRIRSRGPRSGSSLRRFPVRSTAEHRRKKQDRTLFGGKRVCVVISDPVAKGEANSSSFTFRSAAHNDACNDESSRGCVAVHGR